jgi:hypothetical protein
MVVVLAGCDPYFVPRDPTLAEVDVGVEPEGDAHVDLFLSPEHADELPAVAEEAGEALFSTAEVDPSVDDNDGGYDYAHVGASGVYRPGRAPRVRLSTEALGQALAARGFTHYELEVCGPSVPMRFDADVPPSPGGERCFSWELEGDDAWPTIDLTMDPQPLRWWSAAALLLVVVTCAGVGWACLAGGLNRRRRLLVRVMAVVGIVASGVAIATAAGVQGDNLGVSGQVDGLLLLVAGIAPIAVFPLGIACMVELGLSFSPPGPQRRS